jgi:hypothetical protein
MCPYNVPPLQILAVISLARVQLNMHEGEAEKLLNCVINKCNMKVAEDFLINSAMCIFLILKFPF